MPLTFKATVKSFRTDDEGAATLTLSIPASDQDSVNEVSKKTRRTLLVTVFELHEVGQEIELG